MDSSPHSHHLTLTHHRRILTQTLTLTLDLYDNQIGEKGAQSIADALRTNTVSLFLLLTHSPSHPHPHHRRLLTQTLTTLNLYDNEIGEKGAQSIADALRTNTVSLFLLTHSPSHPHSPSTPSHTDTHHTRSPQAIKSARKEPNPSPMP